MKVTYLEHSGFAAEYKEYVLIFDWYRGSLPEFDQQKKIYVFAGEDSSVPSRYTAPRFMYLPVTRIMIILIKKSSGGVSNIQMFGTSFQQILQEKNSQRNSQSGLYM